MKDGGHLGLYPRCKICADIVGRHERVIARMSGLVFRITCLEMLITTRYAVTDFYVHAIA